MTANQRYKEYVASGGQMSFKNWLNWSECEDRHQFLCFNGSPESTLQTTIDELHKDAGLQTELKGQYIFGINKNYLIIGGIALVLISGFLIVRNIKE